MHNNLAATPYLLGVLLLAFSCTILSNPVLASQVTTKKDYRRQTDQQLNVLSRGIASLASKERTLKGASHTRLIDNIRTLRGQLRGARTLWKTLQDADSESWIKIKKKLDTKIIRLNKSYTYILNTLQGE